MILNRLQVGFVSLCALSACSVGANAGGGEPCPDCVIEVHAVVDSALFDQLGFGAEDHVRDVIDGMDAVWSMPTSAGGMGVGVVLHEITFNAKGDPWAVSTDALVLLPNVKEFVSEAYPMNADGRDVVLMFSGLDFDGSTSGLSYVAALCTSFSVGILESNPDNLAQAVSGGNHQLGHIVGATHDGDANNCQAGAYIMSPFTGPFAPPTTFSECSVESFAELVADPFPNIPECLEAPVQTCPADLTGDGALNFFDVSAFLNAFMGNDPIADFTGDGLFNFFDVSAFLNVFSSGCP